MIKRTTRPMKKLWKTDSIDGIIFVCPVCSRYVCCDICMHCGADLSAGIEKEEYKGRVKYD